jgi:hypothetical protein
MVVGILVFSAGAASAADLRQEKDKMGTHLPQNPLLEAQGHATLTLSPMYLEIHDLTQATTAAREELLAHLAAAQEEAEVQQLVYKLERLNTDQMLDVLKIRIRYARLEGRYDLAYRLRLEMLELMQRDADRLM